MQIDKKYAPLILEALEGLMYKTALELAKMKGQPLTKARKELTKKQNKIEALQHLVSVG